ncbi:MAG: phosphatase PAP2 family protein [Patescibacteria group bacterium]|nr:phosphatase PAP2 family protein [Patescibacteria group bacterium]MDE2172595.1 phosphatase PAP2 family protein [Patescibacteria group bacterium]
MLTFIRTLPGNIIHCYRKRYLLWQAAVFGLTAFAVVSGLDWEYFKATRSPLIWQLAWPAVFIGAFVPVLLPLALICMGAIARKARLQMLGWGIGQAAFVGWLISSAYKAVTGRIPPELFGSGSVNISNQFQFGWWNGGILWGWPSSHTAVNVALAVALITMFPRYRWLSVAAIIYATYIGLGVSVTVHWFSDFVAGAILGIIIGTVVGKSFKKLAAHA